MNYNYLRYFSVLAELEHYTLAAARLEISQPSLSSAIRNLENELGVELFEKVGRNIRLTEQGRYFQKKVDAALAELSDATETLLSSRDNAPIVIRIGYVSGSMQGAVSREMSNFLRDSNRFRFHVTEGSSRDLIELLHQEKLDLAIVDITSRDRSLHFRKLRQRNFCVVVPTGHPLAGRDQLNASDLAAYPLIGFSHSMDHNFEDWASRPEVPQHFVCQVNTVSSALELVKAGIGIAIVPDECTHPLEDIQYIPLVNRHQALYSCMVYDRWLDPPVWEFVERIIKSAQKK